MDSSDINEYVVRVPKGNPSTKCVIYKFNGMNMDTSHITNMTVEREQNPDELEGDSGIGSEAGLQGRRKRFGMKPKTKEEMPLRLTVEENGKKRNYRGVREGGISNYSDYWIFEKTGESVFDAYPVSEFYNFLPISDQKAMDIEEVEEHFKRREVVLNQFALRAQIRQPGEGNDDESEGPLSEGSNKAQQSKLGKASSEKAAKKLHKNRKDKWKEREDDLVMEESDDGDEDGREVDYMSDKDSSSSVELEENALIGVDEELTDAFQSVDESEQDDENAEGDSEEGGPTKLLDVNKKTFETTTSFGLRSERDTESSSGSEDPDSEDIKSPFLLQCKTDVQSMPNKRKAEDSADNSAEPEKKAKLVNAETASDSSKFRIMEAEVRHYLERKPMSTTDLVAKFKPRCKKMSKQEIVSQLANILKKLKPEQTRRKGTLYFSLRRT
ncbi:General transcription factor IIF subunit 1 [Trichinella pseudospiralis]|uniref:Transcription initiation factor IIF subunit alpha n=1 Tax=Trichinella pseudospiralis TaxID=6337 RepID=A0A0V1J748_TRIPS|nr:General transcription factor IIF subunit 1 [Trichinella pseudospiralis]KRY78782.1 General transcription factor IIF subunit 1 [Trichinella pseudospiralis]KRZ30801.1 General transcription factor IIF subunit 1 [Trichinella pseudospiralis]KRZ46094.1 General transcription factor IIF subunit 1 [Trichinella pseudospiralis]